MATTSKTSTYLPSSQSDVQSAWNLSSSCTATRSAEEVAKSRFSGKITETICLSTPSVRLLKLICSHAQITYTNRCYLFQALLMSAGGAKLAWCEFYESFVHLIFHWDLILDRAWSAWCYHCKAFFIYLTQGVHILLRSLSVLWQRGATPYIINFNSSPANQHLMISYSYWSIRQWLSLTK